MTTTTTAPAPTAPDRLSPAMAAVLRQVAVQMGPAPAALWPPRTLAALRRRGLVRFFTYVAGGSDYVRISDAGSAAYAALKDQGR